MNVRTRMVLGLVAIAAILLVPLLLSLRAFENLHQTTRDLRDREFVASLLIGTMRETTVEVERAEDALLFVHDPASRTRMDSLLRRMRALNDSLEGLEMAPAATRIRGTIESVGAAARKEYGSSSAGRIEAAEAISTQETRPALAAMDAAISSGEVTLRNRTRALVEEAAFATSEAQRLGLAALAIAVLLATLLAAWLTRTISRPVRDLERGMRAVADGDFSVSLASSAIRNDEFGRLSASYESMTQQLAQLDKVKAEFVSIASHELKTPINVIMGYLELLQENIYGELNPKQREVTVTLMRQAQTLTRLVKRLLDISRFEAGGGKLDSRDINLTRFLSALETSFQVLAHQRGIAFGILHGSDLPDSVHWDEDRMNEVLGNLLSNAFKFSQRDGSVQLAVSTVGDSVRIDVSDAGAGIADDQLPHIFEKFYQADNQAQAAVKGTGLGLAIAREIVVAHGGSISVSSTVGAGTTFVVILPVRATSRHRRRTPPRPQSILIT